MASGEQMNTDRHYDETCEVKHNATKHPAKKDTGNPVQNDGRTPMHKPTRVAEYKDTHNIKPNVCNNKDIVNSVPQDVSRQVDVHKDTTTLFRINGRKEYRVRVSSDTPWACHVISVCTLPDGTLVLADIVNRKLKCIRVAKCTVTDSCHLPYKPWQVCAISKQEVAVSLTSGCIIQLISLGSKMTSIKQIQTDHHCYGLAHASDRLYISDKTSVYIYSATGKKLKQFTKDTSRLFSNIFGGNNLFSSICSLAVDENGSKIYVADDNNGLVTLNTSGKVLSRYNGKELVNASDVCVTYNGGVFVCGYRSNNVLQFGLGAELVGEVLKPDGGEERCTTICYNPLNNTMIVGRPSIDTIEVYDLV